MARAAGAFAAPVALSMLIAACAGSAARPILIHQGETIIGRARVAGEIAVLTDAPAVVMIRPGEGTYTRRSLPNVPDGFKPWGLAEDRDELYTVSGFGDLVRLAPGYPSTRLTQSIGNIFDTPDGMAGQLAVDDAGAPMAWRITPAGALSRIESPRRRASGLSRAEDSLLHLFTCSVPPAVVCWSSISSEIYRYEAGAFSLLVRPRGIREVSATDLITRPELRAIDDVMVMGERVLILHKPSAAVRTQQLDLFDAAGQRLKSLGLASPLRLLLDVDGRTVVALSQAGTLVKVAM